MGPNWNSGTGEHTYVPSPPGLVLYVRPRVRTQIWVQLSSRWTAHPFIRRGRAHRDEWDRSHFRVLAPHIIDWDINSPGPSDGIGKDNGLEMTLFPA